MNTNEAADLVQQSQQIAGDVSWVLERSLTAPPGVGSLALAIELLAKAVAMIEARGA